MTNPTITGRSNQVDIDTHLPGLCAAGLRGLSALVEK
jgi:hypothetical protein